MGKFNIGDVVYLKSGSPAMTITEVNNANYVWCMWFDKNQEVQEQAFCKVSLSSKSPNVPLVI